MRKKHILLLLSVVFFLFGNSCGLLGGKDKEPAIPGKIVFAANDDNQNSQIYTMNADGSNQKQLTDFPASGEAFAPSWSPDGQQIIFSSFKGGISTGPALWVMDADGSNPRFLYHPDPDNEHVFPIIGNNARWSPDGTKVAFDLCLNCQVYTDYTIWIFDTLTKELTQLTPHEEDPGHPARDGNPSWSPDGTQIVFSSNRDYVSGDTLRYRTDLYAINVDGTGLHRLTHSGNAARPKWSPNSDIIAYEWNVRGNDSFLYHISLKKVEQIDIGLKYSGDLMWGRDDSHLLVVGRATEDSTPEMKWINIRDNSYQILHSISLTENSIGREYDLHTNNN